MMRSWAKIEHRFGRRAVGACLGLAVLFLPACTSIGPYQGPLPFPEEPQRVDVSGPLALERVVGHSLGSSAEIASLWALAEIAGEERRGAGDIRDPQLRFGYSEMDSSGVRSSWGTEISRSFESGTESRTDTGSGFGLRSGTESSAESRLLPSDPERTSTSESTSRSASASTSSSTATTTSSGRSTTRSSSTSLGYDSGWRETWGLGLRLFPPNPWAFSGQRNRAAAAAYVAQADLRRAQVELAADVASLYSEIVYLGEDIRLLEELSELHKQGFEELRDLRKQGAATLGDEVQMYRRHLSWLSALRRTSQERDDARRTLAGLVRIPYDQLEVTTNMPALRPLEAPGSDTAPLHEAAMRNRSDLHAAYWRAIEAEAALRESRSTYIPWFSYIEGSYRERRGGSIESRSSEETSRTDQSTGSVRTRSGSSTQTQGGTESGVSETFVNGDIQSRDSSTTTRSSAETGVSADTTTRSDKSVERSTRTGSTTIEDDNDADEWYIGLGIDVPVFSWLRRGAAARAIEHRRAVEFLERLEQDVARQVRDAVASLRRVAAARHSHEQEAGEARDYLRQTIDGAEGHAGIPPDRLLALKAEFLRLSRMRPELDHEVRLASIRLRTALGQIAGVEQPPLPDTGLAAPPASAALMARTRAKRARPMSALGALGFEIQQFIAEQDARLDGIVLKWETEDGTAPPAPAAAPPDDEDEAVDLTEMDTTDSPLSVLLAETRRFAEEQDRRYARILRKLDTPSVP